LRAEGKVIRKTKGWGGNQPPPLWKKKKKKQEYSVIEIHGVPKEAVRVCAERKHAGKLGKKGGGNYKRTPPGKQVKQDVLKKSALKSCIVMAHRESSGPHRGEKKEESSVSSSEFRATRGALQRAPKAIGRLGKKRGGL